MRDELTPREVADELGIAVRTVQRWIASGRLPAQRIGSRMRVSRSSLDAIADAPVAAGGERLPIRALLIANRGEIVERIARSARRLGIRSIGVHAADERAPSGVDEAHPITSYLDADALLEVARRAGADALHPGYGFLAENAAFASAVTRAGLRWVGPPASAIAAMGDKAAARRRADAAGAPTVPGYDGDAQDDATLAREAERIGFPLLVKPSAGGGGKGMRVVSAAADLPEALGAARREAARAFGDDRLILERYLSGSRHVEIQVMFDSHGRGVHLGERDCSAQRRNQKVVEEAPAPSVTPDLRERMGAAAVRAAAAVGYASAGTVEMLLTDSGEYFFVEMNTRLQVEHPVTEAITGRDLVADQLRIAAGATLAEVGLNDTLTLNGHAFEARLYAEDPAGGFLPATGRLALVRWPVGVRVDTGVVEGDEVTDRYDPLLAKVIVRGPDRATALASLRRALDSTTVLGLRTNLRFLRWLLARPEMELGEMRTDTIGGLALLEPPAPADRHWLAAARLLENGAGAGPWGGGWRLNAPPTTRVRHDAEDRSVSVRYPVAGGTDPGPAAVRDGDAVHVDVDGQSLEFRLAPPPSVSDAARQAAGEDAGGASVLVAPMPGRVISVRVTPGTPVSAQQTVVVIEAMKMEHAVLATIDGIVAEVSVIEGQQVQRGDPVAEVRPAD